MNYLPDYTITEKHGYLYVRFETPPGKWLVNRMRAAGMYYASIDDAWLADDRFTTATIIRIIGINNKLDKKEVKG